MKIFVNARFLTQPLSGVQRYAIECSRQIKRLHENTIFVAPPNIINKSVALELDAKITGRQTGHIWEQTDLPLYLSRNGYPPLFNPSNTAPLYYSNNFLTLHDLAFYHHPEWNSKLFSLWYNFMVPKLARKSRHIFTVSNTIKNELIKYYQIAPSKISVTYNGVSADMLSSGGQSNVIKEKIILSVGTFNMRKNHHSLVSAFLASELKNDYRLVLIGDKNKVFRESNLDESMLQAGNIIIHQHASAEELIDLYRKAEILVSLSVYEGFGIPLLEGIFYNCKVVCSEIPVYRELFEGYANFCDPFNIDDIVKALETAVDDDDVGKGKHIDKQQLLNKFNYATSAETILSSILRGANT